MNCSYEIAKICYTSFIQRFLTPDEFYHRWQGQKHIINYPELFEEECEEIQQFKQEYYEWNNQIDEYNDALQNEFDYITEYISTITQSK